MLRKGQQLVCNQVRHGRQCEPNGDTGYRDRAALWSKRIFLFLFTRNWEPIENLVGQGVDLFRVEGVGVALVLLATRAKCLWGGAQTLYNTSLLSISGLGHNCFCCQQNM